MSLHLEPGRLASVGDLSWSPLYGRWLVWVGWAWRFCPEELSPAYIPAEWLASFFTPATIDQVAEKVPTLEDGAPTMEEYQAAHPEWRTWRDAQAKEARSQAQTGDWLSDLL